MTIQHTAVPPANEYAPENQALDLLPPEFGDQHRNVIATCVNGLVANVCDEIKALQGALASMQQQVIQSGARSKHALDEHLSLCIRVHDEADRLREVVTDLERRADDV
jgi:hypothetical protein